MWQKLMILDGVRPDACCGAVECSEGRRVVGRVITSFEVARHSLSVGIGGLTLSIAESPDGRPIHQGSKQPRKFEAGDDLRRAVFLSPTIEIWV